VTAAMGVRLSGIVVSALALASRRCHYSTG